MLCFGERVVRLWVNQKLWLTWQLIIDPTVGADGPHGSANHHRPAVLSHPQFRIAPGQRLVGNLPVVVLPFGIHIYTSSSIFLLLLFAPHRARYKARIASSSPHNLPWCMSSRTLLKLSPLPSSDSHSLPSPSLPGPLALASGSCSHGGCCRRGAAAAMVIASVTAESNERIRTLEYPVVDLSWKRGRAAELLVRACEEFGFVKVVNHGVPRSVIAKMEAEEARFFALPPCEKHKAGPPTPLGYGIRSIGFNGDMGELEYLLLHSNPSYISQKAKTICRKDPIHFSFVHPDDRIREIRLVTRLPTDGSEWIGDDGEWAEPTKGGESPNHFEIYDCNA
ncbi:hypothetical protein B296_00016125 [Ensete ventricosum]|uniref:Non-haem dioxygenase N-terminal domain-containing protein n=1 Tax=Ensete ventricosum TaxID=4639 RepID=A0A426Z817_ENSVE|nr:hypothetical protein B296_00016125 [Ensete ventricosum]